MCAAQCIVYKQTMNFQKILHTIKRKKVMPYITAQKVQREFPHIYSVIVCTDGVACNSLLYM